MTTYGYARVSTRDQDLAAQDAELMAAGCAKVFKEKVSGAKTTDRSWPRSSAGSNPATFWSSPGWTGWRDQPATCSTCSTRSPNAVPASRASRIAGRTPLPLTAD